MAKEIAGVVMPLLFIIISILIHVALLASPFLILYAIYRMIKSLMTHNAELKARERERIGRDL